jgi:hypothetical protein
MFEHIIKQVYVPAFHTTGEPFIRTLCNHKVPMDIMLSAYKKIAPIPEEQVEELMNYATEMYPDETEYFKENVTKVVYTLAHYL